MLDTITVSPTHPPFQHHAIKAQSDDISNAINKSFKLYKYKLMFIIEQFSKAYIYIFLNCQTLFDRLTRGPGALTFVNSIAKNQL